MIFKRKFSSLLFLILYYYSGVNGLQINRTQIRADSDIECYCTGSTECTTNLIACTDATDECYALFENCKNKTRMLLI